VILGSWFYAEVKARNFIQKPEEIVQFSKLTDAQMREIGPLLKKGWTFVAAFREVVERLTPDDKIRALHTRAVENGENWCLLSVGDFGHIVVWGAEKIGLSQRLKTLWQGHSLRNDLSGQLCAGVLERTAYPEPGRQDPVKQHLAVILWYSIGS
jgi:hypothetical protein